MTREVLAAAVLVWLIGAVAGWCAGWAARGEQNRGWHASVMRQLDHARTQLAAALGEVDDLRGELDHDRSPAPVVHVHLTTAPSWAPPPLLPPLSLPPPPQPLGVDAAGALAAVPVGSTGEVAS
jgi:hypothetical protein